MQRKTTPAPARDVQNSKKYSLPRRRSPEPKPEFVERMQELLIEKQDFDAYTQILNELPVKSIRCNTLKISPEDLKQRFEKKNWKVSQPWKDYPEVMIIKSALEPGELGRSIEHLLGYYYIQELASMLPIIALKPKPHEKHLDLCASPGSKTTQASAQMKNKGTILANEVSMGRLRILASNLERCGVANTIITRKEGSAFCKRLKDKIKFNKILVDAPCSGEGTLRSSIKTYTMWNLNTVKQLSKIQKQLAESAFELLEIGGEMIYSTCTHAPEENEGTVDYLLEKFKDKIEIIETKLPIKTRPGITKWQDKKYNEKVKLTCRVYPQDNNTEGFFIAKFRRIK